MRALVPCALLLATFLVPTAAASLQISYVGAPTEPIQPETGRATVEVSVTMDCADVFPNGGTVELDLRSSPGILFSGPQSVASDPCPVPQGQTHAVGVFEASVTRDVPGLTPLEVEVDAWASSGPLAPLFGASTSDESTFVLTAGAFMLADVRLEQKVFACDCSEVVVPIQVANLGNVRAVHSVELLQSSDPDLRVLTPEAIVLDTPLLGGTSNATVNAYVQVPASGQASVQFLVKTVAAQDPSQQASEHVLNVLVRRDGDSVAPLGDDGGVADVPMPVGPMLALGLLGLAGFARRRA